MLHRCAANCAAILNLWDLQNLVYLVHRNIVYNRKIQSSKEWQKFKWIKCVTSLILATKRTTCIPCGLAIEFPAAEIGWRRLGPWKRRSEEVLIHKQLGKPQARTPALQRIVLLVGLLLVSKLQLLHFCVVAAALRKKKKNRSGTTESHSVDFWKHLAKYSFRYWKCTFRSGKCKCSPSKMLHFSVNSTKFQKILRNSKGF